MSQGPFPGQASASGRSQTGPQSDPQSQGTEGPSEGCARGGGSRLWAETRGALWGRTDAGSTPPAQVPALPPACCVTLGKLLSISVPQCPHVKSLAQRVGGTRESNAWNKLQASWTIEEGRRREWGKEREGPTSTNSSSPTPPSPHRQSPGVLSRFGSPALPTCLGDCCFGHSALSHLPSHPAASVTGLFLCAHQLARQRTG